MYNKNFAIFDIESFPNYFLVIFNIYDKDSLEFVRNHVYELHNDETFNIKDRIEIENILKFNLIIGYNIKNYDIPMIYYALNNASCFKLKELSNFIINKNNEEGFLNDRILKKFKFQIPLYFRVLKPNQDENLDKDELQYFEKLDYVDLYAYGYKSSLKTLALRLGSRKIESLPINPYKELNDYEKNIIKDYCHNDVNIAFDLFKDIKPNFDFKHLLSIKYCKDMRSWSEAKIAEYILTKNLPKKLIKVKNFKFDDKTKEFIRKLIINLEILEKDKKEIRKNKTIEYQIPLNINKEIMRFIRIKTWGCKNNKNTLTKLQLENLLKLKTELKKNNNVIIAKNGLEISFFFMYIAPDYLKYKSKKLNDVLDEVKSTIYYLNKNGRYEEILPILKFVFKSLEYSLKKGGLHSGEEKRVVSEDDDYEIIDKDVVSFYPTIIINNSYLPEQFGEDLLIIYEEILKDKKLSKGNGDKLLEFTCKLLLNIIYGKFGDVYSELYSPDLLLKVCLTGQFSLFMLIESLEEENFEILSANTDGITVRVLKKRKEIFENICNQWEKLLNYELETVNYKRLYTSNVNNYIAIRTDGKIKSKGFKFRDLKSNGVPKAVLQTVFNVLLYNADIEESLKTFKNKDDFVYIHNFDKNTVVLSCDKNFKNIDEFNYTHNFDKNNCFLDCDEIYGNAIRFVYKEDKKSPLIKFKIDKETNTYKLLGKVDKSEGGYIINDYDKMDKNILYKLDYNKYKESVVDILTKIAYYDYYDNDDNKYYLLL